MTRGGLSGRAALALACAGLGLAAPPAPAAPGLETIMQDDALLLHRPPAEVAATLDTMAGLGVDRVRATAVWSEIAPAADAAERPAFEAADPGAYPAGAWERLDALVRLAGARGLALDLDVGFWAPRWATRSTRPGRAVRAIDPGEFAHFARAVATRYSGAYAPPRTEGAPVRARSVVAVFLEAIFGDGRPRSFPVLPPPEGPLPPVRMYTVHNEPNHPGFLLPQWSRGRPRSPALYRRMVRAAHAAIKGVDPRNVVLVGATSSIGGDDHGGGVPPLRFLRELACVDRRLRPLRTKECRRHRPVPGDGWAHHPYSLRAPPGEPAAGADEVGIADLPRLTALLDRLVDARRLAPGLRDVWLTEFGYETNDLVRSKPFSAADQARFLPWAEHLAWRTPGVRSFAQFLLRDVNTAGALRQGPRGRAPGSWQTGLVREDGRPKPALASFAVALRVSAPAGVRASRATPAEAWGHVRAAREPTQVRLQLRRPGGWRTVAATRTDARGFFTVAAPLAAGAVCRVLRRTAQGWQPGPAVRVGPR